jgi:hypothetical protein
MNKIQKVFGLGIVKEGKRLFTTVFHGKRCTFRKIYPFKNLPAVTVAFYRNEVHGESFFIGIIL